MPTRDLKLGPAADGSGALVALEEVCGECTGTGFVPSRREAHVIYQGGQCHDCRGAGTLLTEDGRRLLAFLRRHGG